MTDLKRNPSTLEQFTPGALAAIADKLNKIEEKLEKKISYWKVEEAVETFREYIGRTHRCPDNFDYVLRHFEAFFRGRNVAEITPNEVEGFLFSRWGDRAPSTVNKRRDQIGLLFGFCITELKRRGSPDFHNPCELIEKLKEKPEVKEGFMPVGKMRNLLDACGEDTRVWLMFVIMITAGLRVGELLELRPKDVSGRVLILILPKSGRDKEYAVIPEVVAKKLKEYVRYLDPEKPIFSTTRSVVNKLLAVRAKRVKLELSTHDLRKWCATCYDRAGEYGMRRFVLRHSSIEGHLSSLEGRYVANLSVAEAMEKQDRFMGTELLGGDE